MTENAFELNISPELSRNDARRLVFELQLHQVELETQIETLLQTQQDIRESLNQVTQVKNLLQQELVEQKQLLREGSERLLGMETLLKEAISRQSPDAVTPPVPASIDSSTSGLTDRQEEILALVVSGLTSKRIADELNISSATVMAHRRDIMRKLNLHNTAALTRYAIERHAKPQS